MITDCEEPVEDQSRLWSKLCLVLMQGKLSGETGGMIKWERDSTKSGSFALAGDERGMNKSTPA